MAERLGEALLDLDTNDKGLREGISRSERLAQGLGRTFDVTSARAMALGRTMKIAAGIGVVAFGVLVKKAINTADEMSKSAAIAGMTTEEFSRLAWAGELADVSVSTLKTSMGRLNNVMAEIASGGAKDTKALFDQLGISVTDTEGRLRPVNAVFTDLAERFAAMENGSEKTALAIKILGRNANELIPLLNEGRAGLAEAADEADRLGQTISTKAGLEAEEFNDTLTRMGAVLSGLMITIASGLLPELQLLVDTLASPDFADSVTAFGKSVVSIMRGVIEVFIGATKAFQAFMALVDDAQKSRSQLASGMSDADIARELAGARDILDDPASNSVAIDRSTAWEKALVDERRRRMTADPVLGGAQWDEIKAMFGGAASGGALPIDLGNFFSGLGDGSAKARSEVDALIASLRDEQEVLRSSDPVQQRMIALRAQLAEATPEQVAAVRELVAALDAERTALAGVLEAEQLFGDLALDGIEALLTGAKSLTEVLGDVTRALAQAVLQSMLLGQGPLAGLFGTSNAGGGIGGILGSLFSGFFAKGGLIPNGTFGIVGERGPEPVIGTSRGAMVLPHSTLAGMSAPAQGNTYQVIVHGSDLNQAQMTQAISDAISRFDRLQLPQRVAEIQSDPLARG